MIQWKYVSHNIFYKAEIESLRSTHHLKAKRYFLLDFTCEIIEKHILHPNAA
jgi:hypothetical protein